MQGEVLVSRKFHKFSVYEGFLQPSETQSFLPAQASKTSRSFRSHEDFPVCAEGWQDELSLSLVAAEKRVSALLEDRKRLGRTLSSDVLQALYSISRSLHTNPASHIANGHYSGHYRRHLSEQLDRVAQILRRNIQQIEFGVIPRVSFLSEIRELVSSCASNGSLSIQLDVRQEAVDYLTQEEEEELLTVTREALNNCIRHAQATHATISLKTAFDRVTLAIGDDGKGFLVSSKPERGFGLLIMAAKAEKIGWHFTIDSRIGQGTLVKAEHRMSPLLSVLKQADAGRY